MCACVTAVTQIWHLFTSQFVSLCSMGGVTDHAIFFNWWVLIDVRPTLISMAAVAEQINVFCLNHMLTQGAVWIVAVRATDFSFNDWMMRELVSFSFDVFMALKAFFRLLCIWLGCFVDGVAGYAGNVFLLVLGVVPEHQLLILGVALLALCILIFNRSTFTESDNVVL